MNQEPTIRHGEPSLFILSSPFQLLCAVEAMREFQITDYKLVLALLPNMPRNQQLIEMLNDMNLDYCMVDVNQIQFADFVNGTGIFSPKEKKRFHRIFICDMHDDSKLKMLASKYATDGAELIYTDDGNSTVAFLTQHKEKISLNNLKHKCKKCLKIIYRKIMPNQQENYLNQYLIDHSLFQQKYLYTIFYDIPNTQFRIYPNTMSHLLDRPNFQQSNYLVFVGTVPDHFCRQVGIDEKKFELILDEKICSLRSLYQECKFIYVPHGRDVNPTIPLICDKYGITYQRIPAAIEYYMIKERINPKVIYGFNSTALFTLKRIFPDSQITNIRINNPHAPYRTFFEDVSTYYKKNGIQEELLELK